MHPCALLLRQELAERKGRNPHYSLRAFARDLKINPASLSQLLAGKRTLSGKNIKKLAEHLSLSPKEIERLLNTSETKRDKQKTLQYIELEDDHFKIISDWYYYAILNLAKIKNQANPQWIAKRLGISKIEAEIAIERLQRLKLLEVKKGKLVRKSLPLNFNTPSAALRKQNKQLIKLAGESVEKIPAQKRETSSMTFAIDPALIPTAKKKIDHFYDQMSKL